MSRYNRIDKDLSELRNAKKEASVENILALLQKHGTRKGARMISKLMQEQQLYFEKRGIVRACAVASVYDDLSSHPYKVSDCIMCKLNATDEEPRATNRIDNDLVFRIWEDGCRIVSVAKGLSSVDCLLPKGFYKIQKSKTVAAKKKKK